MQLGGPQRILYFYPTLGTTPSRGGRSRRGPSKASPIQGCQALKEGLLSNIKLFSNLTQSLLHPCEAAGVRQVSVVLVLVDRVVAGLSKVVQVLLQGVQGRLTRSPFSKAGSSGRGCAFPRQVPSKSACCVESGACFRSILDLLTLALALLPLSLLIRHG